MARRNVERLSLPLHTQRMRTVVRIAVILVLVVAYFVTTMIAFAYVDTRTDRYKNNQALTQAVLRSARSSESAVCFFPPEESPFRLDHGEVASLSRCLTAAGWMSESDLARIVRDDSFTATGMKLSEFEGQAGAGVFSETGWSVGFEIGARPGWVSALWLVGFALAILGGWRIVPSRRRPLVLT